MTDRDIGRDPRIAERLAEYGVTDLLASVGPGKFSCVHDVLAYEDSLDGCDDEAGDSSEGPYWAGLLLGHQDWCECAARIITESMDGFIDVVCYASDDKARRVFGFMRDEIESETEK